MTESRIPFDDNLDEEMEHMSPEDREFFYSQPVTRAEVVNYVNNLMDQKYMPFLLHQIAGAADAALTMVREILKAKQLVTQQEWNDITSDIQRKVQEDYQKAQEQANEPSQPE